MKELNKGRDDTGPAGARLRPAHPSDAKPRRRNEY